MKTIAALLTVLSLTAVAQKKDTVKNNTAVSDVVSARVVPAQDVNQIKYIIDGVVAPRWLQYLAPVQFVNHESDFVLRREDLENLPVQDINDIVSLSPGVYQQRRGDEVHIMGARIEGTLYILDGMQLCRK